VCLSFDFDALSVWFGYARTTPAMLARGEYGARVGVPRVLELLDRHGIRATFFVPGHTVESFPRETESILDRGHEVAHHSYAHVDPSQQSRDEELADMERALDVLERIGVRPLGYRSPSADLSASTLELVEEHWVHFQFNFDPYRKGGAAPSAVLEIWRGEFDWMDEHLDGGVLTVCMHPQVIGRGHRIAMLDQFIEHCLAAEARFSALGDVATSL
jgi:peptidoglycan/xylan/chitin deacetylase (PgdA/CDA1 family)